MKKQRIKWEQFFTSALISLFVAGQVTYIIFRLLMNLFKGFIFDYII